MSRFEFKDGTSNKFWQVALDALTLTVCFGRIGSAGQTQSKTFVDADAAIKERDRLVAEKTKKGYVEVSDGAQTQPLKSAVSTSITEAAQSVVGKPHTVDQAAQGATDTRSTATDYPSSLNWPSGGYVWDDKLRRTTPSIRGVHLSDRFEKKPPAAPPMFDAHSAGDSYWAGVIAKRTQQRFVGWTPEQAASELIEANLSQFDRDWWRHALLQCLCNLGAARQWLLHQCIERHGLVRASDLVLECAPLAAPLDVTPVIDQLRDALAGSSEEVYLAALKRAQAVLQPNTRQAQLCACLFPSHKPFFEAACGFDTDRYCLLSCAMSVAEMRAFCRSYKISAATAAYYGITTQLILHQAGAYPLLFDALDGAEAKYQTDAAMAHIRRMATPEICAELIARIDRKVVREHLDLLSKSHADALIFSALQHLSQHSSSLRAAHIGVLNAWAWTLMQRDAKATERALAVADAAQHRCYERLIQAGTESDAALEDLPPILRVPPWLAKGRPAALPTLLLPVSEPNLLINHEMLSQLAQGPSNGEQSWLYYSVRQNARQTSIETALMRSFGLNDHQCAKILQGAPIELGEPNTSSAAVGLLELLNPELALRLWNLLHGKLWSPSIEHQHAIAKLFIGHGTAALPGLLKFLNTHAAIGLTVALPFAHPEIAEVALYAPHRGKRARVPAQHWIKAQPNCAATLALTHAFSETPKARDVGAGVLRWMLSEGLESELALAAASMGGQVSAALRQLQATDPIDVLPSKIAKLPNYIVPETMRRPQLKIGGTLNATATAHLASMLSISTPQAPYAGLKPVKQACASDSLAQFAWDLFEAWHAASGPGARDGWPLQALALLGNDETARLLAPKIRAWALESSGALAANGLEILSAIGSDIALMHLNAIANRSPVKALKVKANHLIEAIAEARELSPEQLGDRLVPDLGLDDGGLMLNFGPRQFTLVFDDSLNPQVREQSGVRLSTLPRVTKTDDAELAKAASARFKQLKADAKTIAGHQISRLERAMVNQRRWSVDEFRQFFLLHKLTRYLAQRLCFASFEDGAMKQAFRIAEDFSLADSVDQHYELPEHAQIGIAHPLELGQHTLQAMSLIFADYEIMQPFRQLSRELYSVGEAEHAAGKITRFAQRKVAAGSVLSLLQRGWNATAVHDAGLFSCYEKALPGKLMILAQLDPGTSVSYGDANEAQRIIEVRVCKSGNYAPEGVLPLSVLSSIQSSELLRELDRMAPV